MTLPRAHCPRQPAPQQGCEATGTALEECTPDTRCLSAPCKVASALTSTPWPPSGGCFYCLFAFLRPHLSPRWAPGHPATPEATCSWTRPLAVPTHLGDPACWSQSLTAMSILPRTSGPVQAQQTPPVPCAQSHAPSGGSHGARGAGLEPPSALESIGAQKPAAPPVPGFVIRNQGQGPQVGAVQLVGGWMKDEWQGARG